MRKTYIPYVMSTIAAGLLNMSSAHADTARSIETVCSTLNGLTVGGVTIEKANDVVAGSLPIEGVSPNGKPPASIQAPAHCLIEGYLERRKGHDNRPYAINIQLRVPFKWNGRLLYQGGAGLDGAVAVAYGPNTSMNSTAPPALVRGFAVVSTDSGHSAAGFGSDYADFSTDQQAKLNFGYAAIGKVAEGSKAILGALSGAQPSKTYFLGCSNGGREGLMAASRFPTMFDAVAVGDPAFHLSKAVLLAHYSTLQYQRAGVTPSDLKLVGEAVTKACDASDGRRDGLIFDRKQCHFDPAVLACKSGHTSTCLSEKKVEAIKRAFRGPVDAAGKPMFSSWTYDSGVGSPGWLSWQTGYAPSNSPMMNAFPNMVKQTIAEYFSYPQIDAERIDKLSYSELNEKMAETAAYTDVAQTDLSTFAARGGKLVITTGWSDPIFAPQDLVQWYEKLDTDTRQATHNSASNFARLYMIPGMNHCGGGPAMDDFDSLGALSDWVEHGRAPDALIAHGSILPGQSRPLCAYPKHAILKSGDGHYAQDYICQQ